MFINQKEFKRINLVRKPTGIPSKSFKLNESPPKAPVYHHMSGDDTLGPTPTDLVVNALVSNGDDTVIYVNHVTDLDDLDNEYLGNKLRNENELIKNYHKKYRQFSRVFSAAKVLRRTQPLLINYNMVGKLYPVKVKKPETFLSVSRTNWELVCKTTSELDTDRIQFISINLPRVLKPKEYYLDLLKHNRMTDLRKIRNSEDIVMLDLFAYYAGYQETSILGKYTSEFDNVVLAIRDGNNVIYLGVEDLEVWKVEQEQETAKLNWIYGLFESLFNSRPVVTEVDTETYLDNKTKLDELTSKQAESKVVNETVTEPYDKLVLKEANALLASGAITQAEYNGNLKLAEKYKTITNPFGDGSIGELVADVPVITKNLDINSVPDIAAVEDKSMLDNTVSNLDKEYVENHRDRDVVSTVLGLQAAGIIVTNIKAKTVEDAGSKFQRISIQTKPVKGDLATFSIDLPVVEEDGTFKLGGVVYRMNKQRNELPIVKYDRDTVALTSSVSKLFVTRGSRVANDYRRWLINRILDEREGDDELVLELGDVSVNDPKIDIPDAYGIISSKFISIKLGKLNLKFDYNNRMNLIAGKEVTEELGILVGNIGEDLIYMEGDILTQVTGGETKILGTIEEVLRITANKPVDYSEIKIKGKVIPVGVLLAYWLGLTKFLDYIGARYVEYERNARINDDLGYTITFADVKYNVEINTPLQRLLVQGFKYFESELKVTKVDTLETRSGYSNVFNSKGIANSQEKEFGLIETLWIDPTTKRILRQMPEPTEMVDLLIRATELLTNQQFHEENDGDVKIEKGYSRFNDIVYKELMVGVRELNRGSKTAKRTFSINPKAVKMAILQDAGISPSDTTNPIQSSGERDRITYSGAGGRSDRSMVARHRKFHKNDLGVISEGFTDSGKAGTILYYTNSPKVGSVYGTHSDKDSKNTGDLVSPALLLAPFSLHDD